MMKRKFLVGFCLTIGLMLAGCGNKEVSIQPTTTPNQQETTTEEETTEAPTEASTESATQEPTEPPTQEPTEPPTQEPTEPPTQEPTEPPTQKPTEPPTQKPTEPPTQELTERQKEVIELAISYTNYCPTPFRDECILWLVDNQNCTEEEALFAVDNAGIDWEFQAYLAATFSPMGDKPSKEKAIAYLENRNYSHEDAVRIIEKYYK